MTIEKGPEHAGVDIHLDPNECELLVNLASDAEKVSWGDEPTAPRAGAAQRQSYFSLSVALGKRIRALQGEIRRREETD
jgi:hypothetical protein